MGVGPPRLRIPASASRNEYDVIDSQLDPRRRACYDSRFCESASTHRVRNRSKTRRSPPTGWVRTPSKYSQPARACAALHPDSADIRRLCAARERLDLTPLVIHTNYLIKPGNARSGNPLEVCSLVPR